MNSDLRKILAPAHGRCRHFEDACNTMRWDPRSGHVPRGFCGAIGSLSEVELVLVTAEPGDPLTGEIQTGTVEGAADFSVHTLESRATPFHANIRRIVDLCFPELRGNLAEQLRRTWRTNAVLCSARVECGSVPRQVENTCVTTYLKPQIALFPGAVIGALGTKALRRMARHGIDAISALHPSCRESNQAKYESWRRLADAVRNRRSSRTGRLRPS